MRTDDLRHESRWPRFAAAAADAGVRSMLSVQLFVQGDNLGALNLYASTPGAFDDSHESTAMLLAAHAAVAMNGNKVEGNLRTALVTRDMIGQAKGILMERHKISPAMAFDLLVTASQHPPQTPRHRRRAGHDRTTSHPGHDPTRVSSQERALPSRSSGTFAPTSRSCAAARVGGQWKRSGLS